MEDYRTPELGHCEVSNSSASVHPIPKLNLSWCTLQDGIQENITSARTVLTNRKQQQAPKELILRDVTAKVAYGRDKCPIPLKREIYRKEGDGRNGNPNAYSTTNAYGPEPQMEEREKLMKLTKATRRFKQKFMLERAFNRKEVFLPGDTCTLRLIYGDLTE